MSDNFFFGIVNMVLQGNQIQTICQEIVRIAGFVIFLSFQND